MDEQNIREIVSGLTLEEKVLLCEMIFIKDGNTADVRLGSVPRLNIKGIRNCDNGEGGDYVTIQPEEELTGEHKVCFPQAAALAATWDADVSYSVGKAIGRDARSTNAQMLLRPGVNIKRTPLCGRNFEYFSEDPVLTGELAAAYISGVQSNGIAACIKHYAVNNHEYDRMTANAVVSERALREIYLRPFEIAIEKAKPLTVMTSYNKVNGEWAASSEHLISDIMRKDWGYDGVIVSDGGGIQTNKVLAHKVGMDIELSGNENTAELMEAVQSGFITEAELDEHCVRVLRLVHQVDTEILPAADGDKQYEIALRAAEESAILLKNENNALPLNKNSCVAVIGALAKHPHYMGGGSGHTNARKLSNAYQQMTKIAGLIAYAEGYHLNGTEDASCVEEAAAIAASAERAVVFMGLTQEYEWEGFDRKGLSLPENQLQTLEAVAAVQKNVTVVVCAGSAVDLREVVSRADSILFWYYAGEAMGEAQGNVLYGEAEPAGRLPETFPMRLQDTPAYLSTPLFPNPNHNIIYGEGIYVGYRWYDKREIAPLFAFGHGGSYTDFKWDNLEIENTGDTFRVSVNVSNIGSRPGSEVVQLYVHAANSIIDRPEKELISFQKVYLHPGETATVSFELIKRDFSYFSEEQNKWVTEAGNYSILLGRASDTIELSGEIYVHSEDKSVIYTPMSSLEHIMKAPGLAEALEGFGDDVKKVLLGPGDSTTVLSYGFPIFRQLKNAFGLFKLSPPELELLLERLNNYKN